jgi:hypothetical protein
MSPRALHTSLAAWSCADDDLCVAVGLGVGVAEGPSSEDEPQLISPSAALAQTIQPMSGFMGLLPRVADPVIVAPARPAFLPLSG